MDVREYLLRQIRRCKRKMNLAKMLDKAVVFAAAGGIIGLLCELFSLIRPFYHAHLAAGLCFAAGAFWGVICALCRPVDMKRAAGKLDSFGLKERWSIMKECGKRSGSLFCRIKNI